jgi:hypothetical protein
LHDLPKFEKRSDVVSAPWLKDDITPFNCGRGASPDCYIPSNSQTAPFATFHNQPRHHEVIGIPSHPSSLHMVLWFIHLLSNFTYILDLSWCVWMVKTYPSVESLFLGLINYFSRIFPRIWTWSWNLILEDLVASDNNEFIDNLFIHHPWFL